MMRFYDPEPLLFASKPPESWAKIVEATIIGIEELHGNM